MKHIEKKHRVGLLVPSSNSTQEPEVLQMLPASVSLHVARLSLSRIDPESTVSIVAELEKEGQGVWGDLSGGKLYTTDLLEKVKKYLAEARK